MIKKSLNLTNLLCGSNFIYYDCILSLIAGYNKP